MNSARTCPEYAACLKTASDLVNKVKNEVKRGALKKRNLVWLELTGCSGNIISLLDGNNPDFKYLISQMTNFVYDNSLMASEGEMAMEQLMGIIDKEYILAVEGAVATKNNGLYNIIGRWKGQPVTAQQSKYIQSR